MRELKSEILLILTGAKDSVASPGAEAERILLHVLSQTRPELDSFGKLYLFDPVPTSTERDWAIHLARDRAQGIPLQHLLGYQTFMDRDYSVNGATLVPRPETEILVAACQEWVLQSQGPASFRFAELGLGTGVISCELLVRFPGASGIATETSAAAIELAESNLSRWCGSGWAERLRILPVSQDQGFGPFESHAPFTLLVSNPPYVSRNDEIESGVLLHEPASALFPWNNDPGFFYADFISRAKRLMAPGGAAFFEIPHERALPLEAGFQKSGAKRVSLIPDLTGRPRVLRAEF